ncbi:VOC family protein [Photobacterium angustum]|uniref:VOC family protein n=1 Tax=Photobacterium angustum TaxID=661 RepID=UPI0005E87D39|nr:VOC family protein [Photobacterium angustum]KJG02011.1 lactoylglutathione lyase [Photobacterium angustum]PSV69682.1 VOC family protein [Photobacterium angustum]
MKGYVEHINIQVSQPEKTIHFLLTALPKWTIRGEGKIDNWFGKPMHWYHIGDQDSYVAIGSGGKGQVPDWQGNASGIKHVGIVVERIDDTVEKLMNAGYEIDHWSADHPYRRSVYFIDDNNLEIEFIEYFTDDCALRNDYSQ